ncbi:MAG: AI-2E family transporter [Mycoplasmatota bacterium]|nr:AI-2E family transporter [Mycoplasmatota bacterium]
MKLGNLEELKKWIIVVLIGIFAYWGLNNLEIISGWFGTIYKVFFPFILGFVLAYILNIPTMKIEKLLKKIIPDKYKKQKLIRFLSILFSLLLMVLVVVFIAFLLIPELIENIELLMKNIPGIIDKAEVFILDLADKYPEVQAQIEEAFSKGGTVTKLLSNILNYFINGAIGFVSDLFSGIVNIFTALIFAVYMLAQKESLVSKIKAMVYAFFDKKKSRKIMEIASLSNKTFTNFISGQCVEAVILGTIIFVVSLLCGFPYAILIGVLTAVTALIPIFGAFIALGVGTLLIAISNPLQAIIFVLVFFIVQQIEGNFIYPKVVGKSVGLSPLFTLLAITVGGNLCGVVGMLIGLPLASIVYTLLKDDINNKLKGKSH